MRNIVVIKYKRGSCDNYGCLAKEDASWYCQNGENEAKTLVRWLKDNLIEAKMFSQEEWEKLPSEYPLD